jgi:hypothetical protein
LGYKIAINDSRNNHMVMMLLPGERADFKNKSSTLNMRDLSGETWAKLNDKGGSNMYFNDNREVGDVYYTAIAMNCTTPVWHTNSNGDDLPILSTNKETLAHEVLGHGVSRALGHRDHNKAAIQISNVFLRSQGITDRWRDGYLHSHTTRMSRKEANSRPNFND